MRRERRLICVIPTFIDRPRTADELYAAGQSVSTAAMHREQERVLNPDLVKCGTLPGCRDCPLPFVEQVTLGDAILAVARRVRPALVEADLH